MITLDLPIEMTHQELRNGQRCTLHIITGPPGSGKTKIITQISALNAHLVQQTFQHNTFHDIPTTKIPVLYSENSPTYSFYCTGVISSSTIRDDVQLLMVDNIHLFEPQDVAKFMAKVMKLPINIILTGMEYDYLAEKTFTWYNLIKEANHKITHLYSQCFLCNRIAWHGTATSDFLCTQMSCYQVPFDMEKYEKLVKPRAVCEYHQELFTTRRRIHQLIQHQQPLVQKLYPQFVVFQTPDMSDYYHFQGYQLDHLHEIPKTSLHDFGKRMATFKSFICHDPPYVLGLKELQKGLMIDPVIQDLPTEEWGTTKRTRENHSLLDVQQNTKRVYRIPIAIELDSSVSRETIRKIQRMGGMIMENGLALPISDSSSVEVPREEDKVKVVENTSKFGGVSKLQFTNKTTTQNTLDKGTHEEMEQEDQVALDIISQENMTKMMEEKTLKRVKEIEYVIEDYEGGVTLEKVLHKERFVTICKHRESAGEMNKYFEEALKRDRRVEKILIQNRATNHYLRALPTHMARGCPYHAWLKEKKQEGSTDRNIMAEYERIMKGEKGYQTFKIVQKLENPEHFSRYSEYALDTDPAVPKYQDHIVGTMTRYPDDIILHLEKQVMDDKDLVSGTERIPPYILPYISEEGSGGNENDRYSGVRESASSSMGREE